MKRIKMVLDYDGSNYHGFQWQENANTIQAEIEKAIYRVSKEILRIEAAGRTDTGVHALGQVVAFDSDCPIPPDKWALALNAYLPPDIHIQCSQEVEPAFHPRFDAKKKRYFYQIYTGNHAVAVHRHYAWCIPAELDIRKMQAASQAIIGLHNFKGFCSAKSQVSNFERRVFFSEIMEKGAWFRYIIEADGFLYNMVRIIVGALIGIGRGKLPADTIEQVLQDLDRKKAGKTAPPQGLFMELVEY